MYTQHDLIKRSAGNYTLSTAIGVWTIERVNSHKWLGTCDTSIGYIATNCTLNGLISDIEFAESAEIDPSDGCIVYDHSSDWDNDSDDWDTEDTDINLASETTVDHYEQYRSYDYTAQLIDWQSTYTNNNLADQFHTLTFSFVTLVAKLLTTISNAASKIDYTYIAMIAVILAAIFIAPYIDNAVNSTYLTILSLIGICGKILLVAAPIAIYAYAPFHNN